jgi:hypothetical protein
LNKSNYPEIVATVDTYNGYQFKLSDDTAVPHTNAAGVQTGETYFMFNIIDKPEIENTGDYYVGSGEYIRAWRLKDFIGEKFNLSSDLVTDTYGDVSAGDTLVGRSAADSTSTMKWKVAADVSAYGVYLEVVEKSTFGAFTYEKGAGTIPGGYVVKVCSNDLTE